MKNTEIFYFDVDGTIFDNDTQTVSEKTKLALSKLKDKGYKIALSTGRTLGAIKGTEIENLAQWDAYVLANGGIIMDEHLNMIENIKCEPSFIHDLIKVYPEPIILEGDSIYISREITPSLKKFLGESNIETPPTLAYTDEAIQKVIIEDVNLIDGGFNHPIFDNYDYHLNTANMYEIFPKDSGKHVAIAKYNKILGVSNHTYFGDGNNDVDAIKDATFGVAMGNAVDNAKSIADHTTDSVSNDGVYKALKHFEII